MTQITAPESSTSNPILAGKTGAGAKRKPLLAEWAEMIKLEHSVFAAPFALSGLILGGPALPAATTVLWTILAFVGARAAAMTLNRLIDARIDSVNPRTRDRSIPAGRISPRAALVISILAFTLMVAAASQLPPLCLYLSPIAVFWLTFYSFTKRFTALCHLVLGVAVGGAALGGWIAAAGTVTGVAPWLLLAAVATWVAGFDVIYACQDEDFDRQNRLYSLPSVLGVGPALTVSSLLHVVTIACFIALGYTMSLGLIYWAGIAIVTAMLVYEHSLVSAKDLSRVNAAFFTVNGIVSIVAFCTILADRLWH